MKIIRVLKKWFIISLVVISVSLVSIIITKTFTSLAIAPGPDVKVTYNANTEQSTVVATDPDGVKEIATKLEGETEWTNQVLGNQQGATTVTIQVNRKVVEVRARDNEPTPHTSFYKNWPDVLHNKRRQYTIDKPYASSYVTAVIPGDNVEAPVTPTDIKREKGDLAGSTTKLSFTPRLKDPKRAEGNTVIIKVDPEGDLYIDEFEIVPPPFTGFNTYWQVLLGLLAMAAGLVAIRKARILRV